MSWKPPVTSADRLRARLDDEFETVAKPEGLRRTSDLRRAAEASAAAGQDPEGASAPASQWQRSLNGARPADAAGVARTARAMIRARARVHPKTSPARLPRGRR